MTRRTRGTGRISPRYWACSILGLLLLACAGSAPTVSRGSGSVEVKDGVLLVDGTPTVMASVEIPYYRIQHAADWKTVLASVKESGMNTVSFYVPWTMHEVTEGKFDFTGATWEIRNLRGFIDACREAGLFVVFRIGPYECGEMIAGGIPEWVNASHPDIYMLDYTDSPILSNSARVPSLLHPEYVELVRKWYQAVYDGVLKDNLHTQGGPVIMVSIDNELVYSGVRDAWNYDYNPAIIGPGRLYQNWIQQRYGTIEEYNLSHDPNITTWTSVVPPRVFPDRDSGVRGAADAMRIFDWEEFHDYYVDCVIDTYAGLLRTIGVDVPLNHNFNMPSPDMAERMNAGLFQAHNFARTRSHDVQVTPTFWGPGHTWLWPLLRYRTVQARYAWSGSNWGFNPETPWGSNWGGYDSPFGTMTQVLWEMAHGAKGFNIYLGVDSLTTKGDTVPGIPRGLWDNSWTPYPGCAPIDAQMNRTRLYHTLAQLGAVMKEYGPEIAGAKLECSVALGLYPPYDWLQGTDPTDSLRLWERRIGVREDSRMLKTLELISGAMIRANAEFDIVNIRDDAAALASHPVLITCLYDFMDHATQQRLADFVTGGGTLIAFGAPPRMNDRFLPDTTLLQVLGRDVIAQEKNLPTGTAFSVVGYDTVRTAPDVSKDGSVSDNSIYIFGDGPGEVIATYQGKPCGYSVQVGKGRAVVIGSHHIFSLGNFGMHREESRESADRIGENNFGLLEHLVSGNSTARLVRTRSSLRTVNASGHAPDRAEVWAYVNAERDYKVTYVLNRSTESTVIVVEDDHDTFEIGIAGAGSAMIIQEKGKLRAAILNGYYDVRMLKDNNGSLWGMPTNIAPYVRTGSDFLVADRPTNLAIYWDRRESKWKSIASIGCVVTANGEKTTVPGAWTGRIQLDGRPHDWAGRYPLARDPEGDAELKEIDLTDLYTYSDPTNLYVAFTAPLGSWAGSYGLAIATDQPGPAGFTTGRDAWQREVTFVSPARANHMLYIAQASNAERIRIADFCSWDGSKWTKRAMQNVGIEIALNRPMEFIEVKIPRALLGNCRTVQLKLWVSGGGTSPAYDSIPSELVELSMPGRTNWGGRARFTHMASFDMDEPDRVTLGGLR